jgi:hypothetical protein
MLVNERADLIITTSPEKLAQRNGDVACTRERGQLMVVAHDGRLTVLVVERGAAERLKGSCGREIRRRSTHRSRRGQHTLMYSLMR